MTGDLGVQLAFNSVLRFMGKNGWDQMNINADYPAVYRDKNGAEATVIHNDGKNLSMTVRGIVFRGNEFDDFEPPDSAAGIDSFTLAGTPDGRFMSLCDCVIEWEMPVPISMPKAQPKECALRVRLALGKPREHRGGVDSEVLSLILVSPFGPIRSRGDSGWFEDELLDIQRELPDGVHMKACITCAFSDYHPVGHGLFGGMACFRDNKDGYLAVRSKGDIFREWDTMTEFVQETYLCPEFQRRVPGTGYRG
jgi:hypothetical protein